MDKVYNVGRIRRIIKESENEFKAVVFGDEETKKINDKAYKDIEKETKKFDGGLTSSKKSSGRSLGFDDNESKGMSDLQYDSINKPFQDRVKSQMKGYASKDAEDKHKNDDFGNADFDKDGNYYKNAAKHAKSVKDGRDKATKIGLTGRELDKGEVDKQRKTVGESKGNKIKMLTFKKTKFVNENHMMSRIPDEYKVEGNKFIMRDSAKNEYLVEWHAVEPKVKEKVNMYALNEQKNRIKELWGYKSPEANTTTSAFRLAEDKKYNDMVGRVRDLMK